ncbi:MAG: PilZ domain-containing protein [Desulfobacterales bacterium]|nr:PilZ domain-containing protein [Desulfobacterales bacterium]
MTEKIFLGDSTSATFVCPKCERSRTSDISRILTAKARIKIKCTCKCGHVFPVFIERRKYFRKTLDLSGVIYSSAGDRKYIMAVKDLSQSGCRIKINTSFPFALEDVVQVEFNLDDNDRSFVSKEAVIRSINGPLLGLEFMEIKKYDKIGQYLMFS